MALIRVNKAGASALNPVVLSNVASNAGFTAEVGKHYLVIAKVDNSGATDVTLSGATVDANMPLDQPQGARYFAKFVTATATTISATFVGTADAGRLYPASLD